MPVTAIIAGAEIENYDWLKAELEQCSLIICADSGLRHAKAIGATPDIIIGDFDSVSEELLNEYKDKSEIIHDQDQYSTDLMKALSKTHEDHDVYVYGAVGQRADHDFSNYIILYNRDESNHIVLKTEHDERRVITKPLVMDTNIGDMVGVFPLLPINQLHYEGLQWPAEGIGPPYQLGWNGSCNPAISERVEIFIDSGSALVTRSYR